MRWGVGCGNPPVRPTFLSGLHLLESIATQVRPTFLSGLHLKETH